MYLQQLFAIFPLDDEVLYIPSTVVLFLHPSIRESRRTIIGRYPKTHKFQGFIRPKDRTVEAHKALLKAEYGELGASIRVGEIRQEKKRGYIAYSGSVWKIQAGSKNLFEAFVCASLILSVSPKKVVAPEGLASPLKKIKGGEAVYNRMCKQLRYFSENNRILPGEPAGKWQRLIMPAMRRKVVSTLTDCRSKRWIVMDDFDIEPYISLLCYRAFALAEKSRQRKNKEWRDQVARYLDRQKLKLNSSPASEVDADPVIGPLQLMRFPELWLGETAKSKSTKQLVLWQSNEEAAPVGSNGHVTNLGESEAVHWVSFLEHDSSKEKPKKTPLTINSGQPVKKRKTPFRIQSTDVDKIQNQSNRDAIYMMLALAACILMLVSFDFHTISQPTPAKKEANKHGLADFESLGEYASSIIESQNIEKVFSLPDYSVPIIE
jgi:hypothetical protein